MAKTRKQKKEYMTIPQLRKSFDHIESFTAKLLATTKNLNERRKAFQKEWLHTFHRTVDDAAADSYLSFELKKGKKNKTRKQKGGMAPLDFSLRPGVDGVHGVFPAYITSGFDTYNKINQDSFAAQCGKEDMTPKLPVGLGSNLVGGKRLTRKGRKVQMGGFPTIADFTQALTLRPLTSEPVPSVFHDMQSSMKGQNLGPSPSVTTTPPYLPYTATAVTGSATSIVRDLGNEIRS